MYTAHQLNEFKERIPSPEDVIDPSYALVFMKGRLDAHALVAVRAASRVCDVVCVVLYNETPTKQVQSVIEEAGCHLLYVAHDDDKTPHGVYVDVGIDYVNATHMMQCVSALMPSLVGVSLADNAMMSSVQKLHAAFPELFSVQGGETPYHLLSGQQKKLREGLMMVRDIVADGERRPDMIAEMMKRYLMHEKIKGHAQVRVVSYTTWDDVTTPLKERCFLSVHLKGADGDMRDALTLEI